MSSELWQAEPFGATWRDASSAAGAIAFDFQSLGDRVRGRLLPCAGAGAGALVLVAGPSGRAADAWAEEAARAWSSWACVASIDLPLCGARTSEKLSGMLRGEIPRGAEPLLQEMSEQAQHDLARAAELLSVRLETDGRFAFVGVGLGARLGAGIEDRAAASVVDVTLETDEPDAAWLARTSRALRDRLS